jgi:transposase
MADLVLSLFEQVDKQAALIEEQAAHIKRLEKRIATLERNSRNSSKPPSSDGGNFTNPPKPKSTRQKSGKKRGGQAGHKGHTLKQVSEPDHIAEHNLPPDPVCPNCQQTTKVIATGFRKRQVFDIPPIEMEVTEHQAQQCQCQHCDATLTADFPEEVSAPVQYGSKLQAFCVYFNSYQLLPYQRLSQTMKDLFAIPISQGTVANIIASAGVKAEQTTTAIKEALKQTNILHSDETGCRLLGKRAWLHVASNSHLTFYHFDQKRGHKAMVNGAVLPDFSGHLIHDCWGAYRRFTQCQHGLCNAHLIRELIYASEELEQPWAQPLLEMILKAKKLTQQHPDGLDPLTQEPLLEQYRTIVAEGLARNPEPEQEPGKRGRPKRSKQLNLLRRLDQHETEFLAFMHHPEVPFDNNQAERDLRMMKTREKISGGFGTEQRAIDFCNIRSVISSSLKQKCNILNTIAEMLASPLSTGHTLACYT